MENWYLIPLLFAIFGSVISIPTKRGNDKEHARKRRSVEAFVREEINNMDSSDLFLDIFVNDDFNQYVDYEMLFNHEIDATGRYKSPSSVVQPLPSLDLKMKSRYTRSIKLEKNKVPDSRENELLEKLKVLGKESRNKGFDPQKFSNLLKEYSSASNMSSSSNTLVTDKLVQILYNFLAEKKEGPGKSAPAAINFQKMEQSRTKSVDAECLNAPAILANDTLQTVRNKQGRKMKCFMNTEVDPCDDFYEYACGNWEQYFPIPSDRGGYDTFEILREELDSKLRELLEEDIHPENTKSTQSVKMLYRSCMNTEIIEDRGEKPLLELLDELGGWPVLMGDSWSGDDFDWVELVSQLRLYNNDILVSLWVGPDGKDSDQYIVQFDQSDLVLPSSEYYHQGIDHPIMKAYQNILTNIAILLGAKKEKAESDMHDVIAFEIELSMIMTPPQERRNFSKIYEKMKLSSLSDLIPKFNFFKYLNKVLSVELSPEEEVVIYASKYFKKLTQLIDDTDKRVLANYILMRFIRHRINNLDKRFERIQNELYKLLYGREEMPARWKFCIAYVNGNLGMSVGSLFVRKYFDSQSKQDMLYLTSEIQKQFQDIVEQVDWLSESTKDMARSKLDAMIHNIGYPDLVLNDTALLSESQGLDYKEDEFFENVLKNLNGRTLKEMSMLGQSVNRSIWTTTPAVVNAYYSRNRNQIMFPAGILQPPFYHKFFPKSLNFGGIGVVIGHEITHGFDDKGKQFDEQGNINQWWDDTSSTSFRERAQCIIDQYSDFLVPEVGVSLNGLNTQGENIADNGGIKQAFRAYSVWKEENWSEAPLPSLPDVDVDKLFFLNFAQVWCGAARPEALRSKLKTAVHAPGKYRVLGTLANSEDFARVFQCEENKKMNPDNKCKVW